MTKKSNIKRIGAAGCAFALCLSSALGLGGSVSAYGEKYASYYICNPDTEPQLIYSRQINGKMAQETTVRGAYDNDREGYKGILEGGIGREEAGMDAMKNIIKKGNKLTSWTKKGTSAVYTLGQSFSDSDKANGVELCANFTDLKHDVYYQETLLTENTDIDLIDSDDRPVGKIKFNYVVNLEKDKVLVKDIDVKYTLTPSAYYGAINYTINEGEEQSFPDTNVITVEEVTDDLSLDINFERLSYELKVTDVDFATAEFPENDTATETTAMVLSGNSQDLKIVPTENHKLTKVEIMKGEDLLEEYELGDDDFNPALFEKTFDDVIDNYVINVTTANKSYTVTAGINDIAKGIIFPLPSTVEYGGSAQFSVIMVSGWTIEDVTSAKGDVDWSYDEANGVMTITNINDSIAAEFEKINLTFVTAPIRYEIIEGADQKIDVNVEPTSEEDDGEVTIRISGDYDLFDSVEFDGKLLERDVDYTVTEGSTLLHFSREFMLSAGNGEHTIKANYLNGTSVDTTLTIAGVPVAPDTGFFSTEKSGAVSSLALGAVITTALGAILALIRKLAKKQA